MLAVSCEKDDDTEKQPEDNKNTWQIEVVDSIQGADIGSYNIIALDNDSGVHIVYLAEIGGSVDLKYAYKPYNNTGWTIETIGSDVEDSQIALDINPVDVPYVVYETDDKLMMAWRMAGTWEKTIAVDDHLARYPNIKITNDYTIHLAYTRANFGMRYGFQTSGANEFTIETIGNDDNITGSYSDIVVSGNGAVHVLWHDRDEIKYGVREEADSWTVNSIATGEYTGAYEDVGLTIDANDGLHGYFLNGQADNNLIYCNLQSDAGAWNTQTIANSQASRVDHSIATDTLSIPYIVYGEYSENYALHIASKNSGTWEHKVIDGNSDYRCGSYSDIFITDRNHAHISYKANTSKILKYAHKRL